MSLDLFSSIDFFFSKLSFLSLFRFLFSFRLILIFVFSKTPFKRSSSFIKSSLNLLLQKISAQLKIKMKRSLILISLFFYIFCRKLLGLFPFCFGWTAHILVILQLSLALWFVINIRSLTFNFISYISHFTPQGVPLILGLFLAKIELIRRIIRPLTLSLRLGINITTGHILLALIRVIGVSSGLGFIIIFFLVFYFFFELFVMFIQAVVFTLLLSQYFEENS